MIAATAEIGEIGEIVHRVRHGRLRRGSSAPPEERQPTSNASTIMIEGGEDFDDPESGLEEGEEINFNRADGVPVVVGPQGERRPGGPGAGPGGPAGQRRRRRRGRRPGGPGGGRRRKPRITGLRAQSSAQSSAQRGWI
jgi:hypothetical protein